MSLQDDGFLEFAKPASDCIPSFAELLHDRAAFTQPVSWLPQEFVYMGHDAWGQDAVCGVSSSAFMAKSGHKLACKTSDKKALNPLSIEYAAPDLTLYSFYSGLQSTYRATQTLRVRKDEWEHAFVFCICLDTYGPSQQRHQLHVARLKDNTPGGSFVLPYRVVVKDQLSLDWVLAVPDMSMHDSDLDKCADDFIDYLQGYYRGRP